MNAAITKARRRGQIREKASRVAFDGTTFEALKKDLEEQRIPLEKMQLSDPEVTGLQALIRRTGMISLIVQYHFEGHRPQFKIGNYPDMSIERARKIARTVVTLAERGVDVQEGLHDRLVRELEKQGPNWRP